MEIFFYSNISDVVQSLEKYCFQSKSHQITHFDSYVSTLNSPAILIIFDPFRIKNIYFTISPIWKHYLSIHSPETKLVVMGVSEFESANYIDILNVPTQIDDFLDKALTVNDEWELPIDGANMQDWIERFFEGHGGTSVVSKLTGLCQTLDIAYQKLADGSNSFDEIKKELLLPLAISEWQEVITRWQYYMPLFEYLPFYPAFQEINEIFSDLSENFSCFFAQETLFLDQRVDVKLKQINQKLTEIDRLYIRSRLYES